MAKEGGLAVLFKGVVGEKGEEEDAYVKALSLLGIHAIVIPALDRINVNQSDLCSRLAHGQGGAEKYSAVVVTSPRALQSLEEALAANGEVSVDSQWAALPLYAIGPTTATAASVLGFKDIRGYTAGMGTALGHAIVNDWSTGRLVRDTPLLHFCGSQRREELCRVLSRHRIPFQTVVVYETLPNKDCANQLSAAVGDLSVSWVVFFSPSGVMAALSAFQKHTHRKSENRHGEGHRCLYASIGQTTAKAMQREGCHVDAIAERPNPMSLIQAMQEKNAGRLLQ